MFLTVRNCCCCFSLKNGSIIVGVLELVFGLAYVIAGSLLTSDSDAYGSPYAANTLGALMVMSGALLLLFAICLLAAVLRGNPLLLVPWLSYALTFLIANTFLHIISAAQDTEKGYDASGAINSVVAIIALLLQSYFVVVVYSFYSELKGPEQANHTTPSFGATARTGTA